MEMTAVTVAAGADPVHPAALLAEAAVAVHGQRDLGQIITWVLEHSIRVSGATAGGIWLIRDGIPEWATSGHAVLDPSVIGDPRDWPSLRPAMEHGMAVRLADGTQNADPSLRRILRAPHVLVIPLPPVIPGEPAPGALLLVGDAAPAADPVALATIEALIAHLSVAVVNVTALHRLSDLEASQRSVVRQLQEAVFTPAPTVPHTELGMHYVASDESAPTGGDLYDWVVLPDGQLHVAVVDIMGKGVAATKDALAVTHALRLLVLEGCPLGDLIARADELASAHNPDLVATLVVGRFDPQSGLLRIAGGGHPPPLLVAGGTVTEIMAPGIPIGWPGAGSSSIAEVQLDRSDTVILYTDGLVESTKDIVKGLENLSRYALETASYPAATLARALVERALRGVARHDDSLALVLRRRTPPPDAGRRALGPFEHRFTPSTAGVTLARHLLGDWLVRLPVEGPTLDDLLLIAAELCSNAARHASGLPGSVTLRAWASGADVVVEVEDDGGALTLPEFHEVPDTDAEQGRGLFLVESLSDELSSESWTGHTAIRVVKRAVVGTHSGD
jgi:serine phosphatase RsbU (regulator of sigma subunit)/anti-sigma regulatory factor (Ser/Thr protein kinase)